MSIVRGLWPALALSTLLLVSHAATQGEPQDTTSRADTLKAPVSVPATDPRLGERTYMKNCANCHRADGRGGRQPTATGDPVPSFREVAFWAGKTDSALVAVVENGVPNSSMVAWKGVLTREEILAVARFVRDRYEPRTKRPAEPEPETAAGDSADTASVPPRRN